MNHRTIATIRISFVFLICVWILGSTATAGAEEVVTWGQGLDASSVTIEARALTPAVVARAKKLISTHGIVFLDLPQTAQHQPQMRQLVDAFGLKVRARQNQWRTRDPQNQPAKEITPSWDPGVQAGVSGDSANELGLHVDGTQHQRAPALMIFKYARQPAGTTSVWVDLAHVLKTLPAAQRERMLVDLASPDAAETNKSGMRWRGPVVTRRGDRVAVRTRFDSVLKPNRVAEQTHKALARAATAKGNVFTMEPKQGMIVLFDNTRLMHGRGAVTGPRTHYRVWAEAPAKTGMKLGIPVTARLLSKIKAVQPRGDRMRHHHPRRAGHPMVRRPIPRRAARMSAKRLRVRAR